MESVETILAQAEQAGKEYGEGLATWVFDGNTPETEYRRVLKGFEEGDPEIMDMEPSPLSGEWADGLLPRDVLGWYEMPELHHAAGDVLDAFEAGFHMGFWDEITRAATLQVS